MKFLATLIYQAALATSSKLGFRICLRLRKCLLRFRDPLITATFRGFRLTMPFSHTIFLNQKLYPFYDMRLQALAQYISAKNGRLAMVDVGANIGDTAVFSQVEKASYLLIEGSQSYADLIPTNLCANGCSLHRLASTQSLECIATYTSTSVASDSTTSDSTGGGGEIISSSIFARHF